MSARRRSLGVGTALLLAALPVEADRLWLHGLSRHTDGGDYNEVNEGFGIELSITDRLSAEFGRYRNSFKRPTRYAWLHYEFARHGRWRFGGALGTADNYDCQGPDDSAGKEHKCRKFDEGKGVPIGGMTVQYWRVRLLLIPSKRRAVEVAALSLNLIETEW